MEDTPSTRQQCPLQPGQPAAYRAAFARAWPREVVIPPCSALMKLYLGAWCPAEGSGFAQSKEEKVKERHYYCYLLGQYREHIVSLFLEVHSDETRCSGHKLQLGNMQLGIRKSFF